MTLEHPEGLIDRQTGLLTLVRGGSTPTTPVPQRFGQTGHLSSVKIDALETFELGGSLF